MNEILSRIDSYLKVIDSLSEQVSGEAGEKIRLETSLARVLIEKQTTANKGNKKK